MVGGKRYCVLCSNYVGKIVDGRSVSLHRIPKDKNVSKAWIQRMKLIRKDLPKISGEVRVCSEHFKHKQGPKPGDSIPSVFAHKHFNTSCVAEPEKKNATKPGDSSVKAFNTSLKTPTTTSNQALSVYMHDYCGPVKEDSLHLTKVTEMTQTESAKFVDAHVGADFPTVTCDAFTRTENGGLLKANDILCSDKRTKQYTGIPTANTFRLLFDCIPTINVTKSKKCSLDAIDEMLLTLMRIRLALPIFDLAFRFSISPASCSRIISRWIQHLYVHLSFMTFWPSRIQINNTMPSDFKKINYIQTHG